MFYIDLILLFSNIFLYFNNGHKWTNLIAILLLSFVIFNIIFDELNYKRKHKREKIKTDIGLNLNKLNKYKREC